MTDALLLLLESFFTSVFAGGVLVWFYNHFLYNLRESHVKKGLALSVLPFAVLVGVLHGVAIARGWPRITWFAWGGAVIFLLRGARLAQQWRWNRGTRRRRLRMTTDGLNWPRFPLPARLILKALAPINQVAALEVVERDVYLPNLHPDMDGYRVTVVTDFHVHKWTAPEYPRQVVRQALALKTDALLLGGDFVSRAYCCDLAAELLDGLRQHPCLYAVRGNHDFWTTPSYFTEMIRKLGGRLLTNEVITLRRGEGAVELVGLEHPYIPLTNKRWRELLQAHTRGVPRIGLVHTPEAYREAERLGCSVAVAGHTHGGQVRIPYFGTTIASCGEAAPFIWGSGRMGRMETLTSNGVGAFYPLRVLCPPQIVVLNLKRRD